MNFLAKIYQRPLDWTDSLLDGITSYRLVLYFLLSILGWAGVASFRGQVPFSWHAILVSASFLVIVCRLSGELFSKVLNIARNFESDYITALILALIMTPAGNSRGFAVLAGAGFVAVASKYLLTIGRRHIFNPAAAGAFVAAIAFNHYASWWVGTTALAPLVVVGGLLVTHKMKRFIMIGVFLFVYALVIHLHSLEGATVHNIWLGLSGTGILFFAFIMLTEPLTSPDSFVKYVPYSVLVGLLYSINRLGISPEEALLIGNLLAYGLVFDKRLELSLARVVKEAEGIYSFIFSYQGALDFKPGQYMEWTLPLAHSDRRGNRRYLTLTSSPTEDLLAFAVQLPKHASHFKKALANFKPNDRILASQLAGSFTLPANQKRKLAFIAGGIGITPFRSIVKYLIDAEQERSVKVLYCASRANQFAFKELFKRGKAFGVETEYLETSHHQIDASIIAQTLPDYRERLFYVSGPYGFVKTVRSALLDLGVKPRNIKADYFPGYG